MMNPHIDAVPLAHAGRTATVRFTWAALAVIQRDWGADWRTRFVDALEGDKVDDLADLMAATTGLPAAEVIEWSPPLADVRKALWDGYHIVMIGKKADATEGEGGVNPLKALSMISKAFAGLRSGLASVGPSSGTRPPTQPA